MMDIKILFVDDENIIEELVAFFNEEVIKEFTVKAFSENSFEGGLNRIHKERFDIVVLDLCRGKASDESEQEGLNILTDIQKRTFIPVIFHSAVSYKIYDLKSLVVGVSDKKNGMKELKSEIERIISSNTILLKTKIHHLVEDEFKNYFWDVIHNKRNIFVPENGDGSLGYLILRRLANSLSKENIKKLLDDNRPSDNALPMEFYVYPTLEDKEFEAGDIISYNDKNYVLLTPDCDYIERFKKGVSVGRKAEKVLLANIIDLENLQQYKDYKSNASKENLSNLNKIISNNFTERYFFLPGTPFLKNSVIDFQDKIMVEYSSLDTKSRITKLDLPFAQSMVTNFIRYYNRIGFPDIDAEFLISKI
jgi:DNA-binding NarL/FixJ family response regulator